MSTVKRVLSVLGWIITIPVQAVVGYCVGYLAPFFAEEHLLIPPPVMWLGITISLFVVGGLAILLRRSIRPKRYLARLGLTSLGAFIPMAILTAMDPPYGLRFGIVGTHAEFDLLYLAILLGLVGFYVPGWIRRES